VWYRRAVFYQIYPLSFQDGDGDGRGDLRGILSRVDHLAWLGVDAVWLCPVYPSPMDDFGYDIADYCAVDPVFGSIDDFDRLLDALHRRGIRLVLDFVPNHTSDRHPWFEESRASRNNPKSDWYIWADPRPGGGPPNNWLGRFGGSAWTWEPRRQQYYLHSFLESQPELNVGEPRVMDALAEVMRFWLRRGVDGFRIDAAAVLAKDPQLRDDPPNPEADDDTPPPERQRRDHSDGQPASVDLLATMRSVADEFRDRVLLGEVDTSKDRIGKFYGTPERPALHLPLSYLLLEADWNAAGLVEAILGYLRSLPAHGWPLWAIGGQDKKRIASAVGERQAPNAALLALTLPGTPLFYAGDEIGMQQVCRPDVEPRDPFEKLVPGYGLNRDPERAPMTWDETPNAGFTSGRPWLPIADDWPRRNVAVERADPASILHVYRRILALRRAEPALVEGDMEGLAADGDVLRFARRMLDRRLHVAVNPVGEARTIRLPDAGRILVSTCAGRDGERVARDVRLSGDEGVVVATD
jgi:alpha-glucosidase